MGRHCFGNAEILAQRVTLFIAWYKQLRERRHEFSFPFYYHTSYNIWNCIRWAFYNSGHNNLDGSYLKKNKTYK